MHGLFGRSFGAVSAGTARRLIRGKHTLVLLRHGESTWNEENKFTGWYDCPLSTKGHAEAAAAGQLLNKLGFHFDVAYTSFLKRAIRTLWHTLEACDDMNIPVKSAWELNERHYGGLQGLDKQETVTKFGPDQVKIWRRSYDIAPPPCDESSPHNPANNPKYASLGAAMKNLPRTESLKLTLERVLPFWEKEILPDVKAGKRVIVAAHGNTLRALVKHLDNIPEAVIAELNIPTGVPLVYEFDDKTMAVIPHPDAIKPLQGRYLGDQENIRARIQGVKNQTK